jgi:hypothetical protein
LVYSLSSLYSHKNQWFSSLPPCPHQLWAPTTLLSHSICRFHSLELKQLQQVGDSSNLVPRLRMREGIPFLHTCAWFWSTRTILPNLWFCRLSIRLTTPPKLCKALWDFMFSKRSYWGHTMTCHWIRRTTHTTQQYMLSDLNSTKNKYVKMWAKYC